MNISNDKSKTRGLKASGLGLLLIITISSISCRDEFFKEVEDLSDLSTNEQLNSLLKGAKAGFNDTYYWTSFWQISQHADEFIYYVAQDYGGSDAAEYGSPYDLSSNIENANSYSRDWNLDTTDDYYKSLYKNIISLNKVVSQDNGVYPDEEYKHILGEAYLFRAYSYFMLTRVYNDIPLINDLEVSYDVKLSTSNVVYEFVISDIMSAIAMLPTNATTDRPYTSLVAKALLSQVYLCMAGYPVNDIANTN